MKPRAIAPRILGHGLAIVALAAGCEGGHQAAPRTVLSNRSATPAITPAFDAPLILWCTTPGGVQCRRAARKLRVEWTTTSSLPPGIFAADWRDLDDDCADPDLASLLAALGAALSVPADGWVDQGGSLTLEGLARVAHGGGCTNSTSAGVPDVKVQLAQTRTGLLAFVRVWELEETQ